MEISLPPMEGARAQAPLEAPDRETTAAQEGVSDGTEVEVEEREGQRRAF